MLFLIKNNNNGKKMIIIICCLVLQLMTKMHAQLVCNGTNDFINYTNFNPANNLTGLTVLGLNWKYVLIQDGEISTLFETIEPDESYFIKQPLVYPSPVRIQDGGILGYSLSRSDIDLELIVYDMFGFEITRKAYTHNSQGAFLGYNRLTLNAEFFDFKPVSAGVYFFVFLHDSQLMGKGKFAVAP